jgi:DNA-binding Xre family transcriptional regulator
MNKHDLMEVASLSTATVAKMTKGENLNTDILVRVCNALHCTASDILEIYPDEKTIFSISRLKKYDELVKYIGIFTHADHCGEWVYDRKNKGTHDDPIQTPYVKYSHDVMQFVKDISPFMIENYIAEIQRSNIGSLHDIQVETLNERQILVVITKIVRGERFSDGLLLHAIKDGIMAKLLTRLISL